MSVPMAVLRACAREMPRLQAEEMLMAAQSFAIGSGSMKAEDARAMLSRLNHVATGGTESRQKATPQVLATMGVAVVRVKRKAPRGD